MATPPLLVAAQLLLGEPETSPTWHALDAECAALRKAPDPVAAAEKCREAFEAVPNGPGAWDRRALLLSTAHTLYQKAQQANGDVQLACADAAMLRAFEAKLATLPPDERPGDRADVASELRKFDPSLSAKCPGPSPEPKSPPEAKPPVQATRSTPLRATEVRPPPHDGGDRTRPRRPLRVAGGAVLGVGLGFGVAMIAALVRGADLRAQVDATRDKYDGQSIATGTDQQYDADVARGELADRLAIGLGVTAAALASGGVALLVIDRRRGRAQKHVTLAPLIMPTAGVRLALEF